MSKVMGCYETKVFPNSVENYPMGYRIKTFTLAFFIMSCQSFSSIVFSKIHIGSPKDDVLNLYGRSPDEFGPSKRIEGAQAWYYKQGNELCGFTISNDKVAHMACQTTGPSAFQRALTGFGEGMQQSFGHQNTVNCTSNTYGNTTQTQCQSH